MPKTGTESEELGWLQPSTPHATIFSTTLSAGWQLAVQSNSASVSSKPAPFGTPFANHWYFMVAGSPLAGSIGMVAGGQPLAQVTMLFGAVVLRGGFTAAIAGASGTPGMVVDTASQTPLPVLHMLPAQHS
jgi:hypothetical protein